MRVTLSAEHLLPDLAPLGEAAAGVDAAAAFPLVLARCELRLAGPPTPLANSLVRVLMSELPGWRLEAPPPLLAGAANRDADPFALAGFVQVNVATVPLAHGALDALDAEAIGRLRWRLDVENRGGRAHVVMSDELAPEAGAPAPPDPLIMPGVPIALVQPGKTLRLRDVRLVRAHNAADGRVNTAVRGRLETHAAEHPRLATHGDPLAPDAAATGEGAEAGNSGFVESPLLADNREHTVHWLIPALPRGADAAAAAGGMVRRACALMAARCEALGAALGERLASAPVDPAALGKHAPPHPLTLSTLDLDLLEDRTCRTTFAVAFLAHLTRSPVDLNPDVDMATHLIRPDGGVFVRVRHRRDDPQEFFAEELAGLAEVYREIADALD